MDLALGTPVPTPRDTTKRARLTPPVQEPVAPGHVNARISQPGCHRQVTIPFPSCDALRAPPFAG